jgi:hypothetical protein
MQDGKWREDEMRFGNAGRQSAHLPLCPRIADKLPGIESGLCGQKPKACIRPTSRTLSAEAVRRPSFLYWGAVEQNTFLLRPLRAFVPAPDGHERGAIGGMLGRGSRITRRKAAPVPLCPPQIPPDLTRARSRRLTSWARERPRLPSWWWNLAVIGDVDSIYGFGATGSEEEAHAERSTPAISGVHCSLPFMYDAELFVFCLKHLCLFRSLYVRFICYYWLQILIFEARAMYMTDNLNICLIFRTYDTCVHSTEWNLTNAQCVFLWWYARKHHWWSFILLSFRRIKRTSKIRVLCPLIAKSQGTIIFSELANATFQN